MVSQESLRAIQALNPLERAVFALTRAVIGNKRARSLFILYAACLVSRPQNQKSSSHELTLWAIASVDSVRALEYDGGE